MNDSLHWWSLQADCLCLTKLPSLIVNAFLKHPIDPAGGVAGEGRNKVAQGEKKAVLTDRGNHYLIKQPKVNMAMLLLLLPPLVRRQRNNFSSYNHNLISAVRLAEMLKNATKAWRALNAEQARRLTEATANQRVPACKSI